jgi:hypothetical protein
MFLDQLSVDCDSKLVLQLLDCHSMHGHDHCYVIACASCQTNILVLLITVHAGLHTNVWLLPYFRTTSSINYN